MRRAPVRCLVAVLLIVLSPALVLAAPQTDTTTEVISMRLAQDETWVNPCNGEEVTFSGMVHELFVKVHNYNEFTDFEHRITAGSAQGFTGVGSLGNTYWLSGAGHEVLARTTDYGGCGNEDCLILTEGTFVMITQGSGLNFRSQTYFNLVYTMGGELVSVHWDDTAVCLGQGTPEPVPDPPPPE
jgi:hypothetical protein